MSLIPVIALLGLGLQAPKWPEMEPAEMAKTVFIVHELSGPAVLVRGGKTYKLEAFTAEKRQAKNQLPLRLAVLDRDQFWLEPGTTGVVSFVLSANRSQTQPKLQKSEVIGNEFREKGTTYLKSYAAIPKQVLSQIELLVRLGQNSRIIVNLSAPRIVLPLEGDVLPPERIPFLLWSNGKPEWGRTSVTAHTGSGDIELWTKSVEEKGAASLSREDILAKLASSPARRLNWDSEPLLARLLARGPRANITRDFRLAEPNRAAEIMANIQQLDAALAEKGSVDRDVKIAGISASLNDSLSLVLAALAEHQDDPSVRAMLFQLCESKQLSPKFFTR